MRAHLAAACAAVAAVGLLAACSARGGSAAPQATATVTVTAAPSSPAAGTGTQTTPAAQPTSQAPPPVAACSTRYLGAKLGASQGATGSTYVVLVFTNLNNSPCTLYGYPGVALDNGKPATPVGLSAAENPATPRELVTLAPHGTASALLRIVHAADYSAAKCNPVTANWLQIIPPNQYVPIYLGYTTQTCANPVRILTVGAVRPGSGG